MWPETVEYGASDRQKPTTKGHDWPFFLWPTREGQGGWGVAPVARNPWQDAVAAASGISGEVSFAVAADDLCGACMLHAPVFWEVD